MPTERNKASLLDWNNFHGATIFCYGFMKFNNLVVRFCVLITYGLEGLFEFPGPRTVSLKSTKKILWSNLYLSYWSAGGEQSNK